MWLVDAVLLGAAGGPRHPCDTDTAGLLVSFVFIIHAPLIATAFLTALRLRTRQPVNEQDIRPASKATLARLEPVIGLGCACLVSMLFWPAPARAVEAALRAQCGRNLQKLAVAAYEYENRNGHPLEDIRSRRGKPLLSWRVALLPFLNEADLMSKFHIDEPWDSANNAQLLRARPDIFACPSVALAEGSTNYVLFCDDGQRAIGETGQSQIPWTKPSGGSEKANGHRANSGAHGGGVNGRVRLDQFPLPKDKMPDVEWVKVEDHVEP
ncbi:MAG: DUF1559 domain-containing protein [Thermoguttaceae bacterium]